MKYFKTLGVTKNYNGSLLYNHETKKAYSYEWYEIARVMSEEFAIVNTYTYSNTTAKHVGQISGFIRNELGISNIVKLQAPRGLQSLDSILDHYETLIKNLEAKIAKPRTHKAKNLERKNQIRQHQLAMDVAKNLLGGNQ